MIHVGRDNEERTLGPQHAPGFPQDPALLLWPHVLEHVMDESRTELAIPEWKG